MRLSWFRVDPDSNVWCPMRMEGFETQGGPCEDRSRESSYAAASQGQGTLRCPAATGSQERGMARFSPRVSSQEEPTLPTP